jgi:hypothetical protein
MRKSAFVLALLAASFSGAAMAKDVAKKQMSDAEMDKVTAGQGFGLNTASANGGNAFSYGLPITAGCNAQGACVEPGYGQTTASTAQ